RVRARRRTQAGAAVGGGRCRRRADRDPGSAGPQSNRPLTGAILDCMAPSVDTGIDLAGPSHADELAALAAETFPLACPPTVTEDDVRDFIGQHLTSERFTEYLADPDRTLLLARDGGAAVAYAMLVHAPPADPAI